MRKRWLQGRFKIGAIGPALDLTYPVTSLGAGPDALDALISGSHSWTETLKAAKTPMLILGQGAVRRRDGAVILGRARKLAETYGFIKEEWNGFNVLHTAAARVAGLDLGFAPGEGGRDVSGILERAGRGDISVVYLLGADEIDTTKLGTAFVIYQGHHGDAGARRADVVLPGAAYTEKDGTYVNTEGRAQLGRRAVFPPGDAREDWKIVRALSEMLGHKLPYDTIGQLRRRLASVAPSFANVDAVTPAAWGLFGSDGPLDPQPFAYAIGDFYHTDPISRASPTMVACAHAAAARANGVMKTSTHG